MTLASNLARSPIPAMIFLLFDFVFSGVLFFIILFPISLLISFIYNSTGYGKIKKYTNKGDINKVAHASDNKKNYMKTGCNGKLHPARKRGLLHFESA